MPVAVIFLSYLYFNILYEWSLTRPSIMAGQPILICIVLFLVIAAVQALRHVSSITAAEAVQLLRAIRYRKL